MLRGWMSTCMRSRGKKDNLKQLLVNRFPFPHHPQTPFQVSKKFSHGIFAACTIRGVRQLWPKGWHKVPLQCTRREYSTGGQ